MNTCYYPNCASSMDKLWSVANTPDVPLKYQPFYVCHAHLESEEVLSAAFKALCQARFENPYGNKLEKDGWILDKQIRTWKKANEGQECDDCQQTNKLWILGDWRPVYLCDTHLSRKKTEVKDIGAGKCYPKEDTWLDEGNLQMMESQIVQEKQNNPMENLFVERVIAAAQSQFELIMKKVHSNDRDKLFEFFTLSRREYTFIKYPISDPCHEDILYRRMKEKIIIKIKEMFGPTFTVHAQKKKEKTWEYATYNIYNNEEKRGKLGASYADIEGWAVKYSCKNACTWYDKDEGEMVGKIKRGYEIRALHITWDNCEHYDYE